MEALSVDSIPVGETWRYEPKWDGFRCLAFRDGAKVELQSKSGRSMSRYFPELTTALGKLKPKTLVLDGEIVVPADGAFSFDALLTGKPLDARRRALELFFQKYCRASPSIRLSPSTTSLSQAKEWLRRTGATLDGVIAKRRDFNYRTGDCRGMQKIKNFRSADCVVGGFRCNENSPLVGSLLLGLYDRNGRLNHVGFTSTIKREDKPALDQKAEIVGWSARLHRRCAWRPEPLGHQAISRMGAAKAKACRGSLLRLVRVMR
jgi:ATP-dependent DNA ligase